MCCLLETLRGAAHATLPSTQPALWQLFSGLLQPLLQLHWAFRHQPQVVALLLKLADDIVESQAHCLPAPLAEQLLGWALKLLTQYSESNLWQVRSGAVGGTTDQQLHHACCTQLTPTQPQVFNSPPLSPPQSITPSPQVSLQTAKSLRDERQAEQCRDLRAVLNLLLHVTQSELLDDGAGLSGLASPPASAAAAAGGGGSGGGAEPPGFDVARVVLVGLHIVLPLINPELLKFPKLGRLYYSLLAYLLEAHTASVAALEPRHFASLMASLEWGLAGSDGVAAHSCLEGVAGLARYQHGAAQTGGPGLAAHAPGESSGGRAVCWLHLNCCCTPKSRFDRLSRSITSIHLIHPPLPAPGRSVVAHFQEVLLHRLLLDDTPQVGPGPPTDCAPCPNRASAVLDSFI